MDFLAMIHNMSIDPVRNGNRSVLEDFLWSVQKPRQFLNKHDARITNVIFSTCGTMICLMGITANIINIKTFLAMGIKDGVSAIFLSISCSDLAVVLLLMIRNIFSIILMLENLSSTWWLEVHPRVIIFYSDNFAFIMYTITMLTAGILAVVRCMGVAKPLHFRNAFTLGKVLFFLILAYLFPICCQTAVFYHMGVRKRYDPVFNDSRYMLWLSNDREQIKDVVRLMLRSIIPLIIEFILLLCISIMVFNLKKTVLFREASEIYDGKVNNVSSVRLTGKERQVVKQVILILSILVILNVFGIIFNFITLIDNRFEVGKEYEQVFNLLHQIQIIFESLNASLNVFVYYYYNPKFRSLCFTCKI